MRPYKMLFFCNKDIKNPVAGGGTWELFRLMKRLVERGYSVTLVCSNFLGGKKRDVIDGIRVIRLGGTYSVWLLGMLKYLRSKELKEHDVIVDVALMGIPFFTPLYTGKPVIGICWHLPRETFFIELMHKMGKIFGFLIASLACFIEDAIAPLVYRNVPIFTFSESSRRDLMNTGFRNIFTVEYALARSIMCSAIREDLMRTTSFRPGEKKNEFPLVVYLGRLKKYKGVQDAIKAMSLVIRDAPNACLYVIGNGEYELELRKLTKKLSLEDNVNFLGYVSVERKIELLRKAHALVMPSYKEGFSTPVFEANMCGTVAVVSSATGVKESVKHGVTGFIYPLGNHKKMAEYIKIILKDEGLRQKMEENVKYWAKQFYFLQENEDTFIDNFRKVLDEIYLKTIKCEDFQARVSN